MVAFDDAPFDRAHRGDVPVVGAVFAGLRLDGVLSGRVRRDGANAARAALIRRLAVNGREPEPLRVAHLIATAFARMEHEPRESGTG